MRRRVVLLLVLFSEPLSQPVVGAFSRPEVRLKTDTTSVVKPFLVSAPAGVAQPRLGGSRVAELALAAWQALKAGRFQDASDAFAAAIAADPREATLYFGAGVTDHLLGRSDRARAALQEALRLDPSITQASLLLGELTFRAGDVDEAIRVYEAAQQYASSNEQLRTRLERWRKEAELHGSFRQTLGNHFTVLFEGPAEEDLARRAVDVLESAYWRVGTALFTYPNDVITVILYTQEQFRDITRSPSWSAGLYDGRIRVPMRGALNNPEELERVLTHEFTHALVRSVAPRGVPTWLNEGLAVLFESVDLAEAEALVREAPALIPLAELHGSFDKLSPAQAKLAYAQSALAARALIDRAGTPALINLLTDVAAGASVDEAFLKHIFTPYADFQAEWPQQIKGARDEASAAWRWTRVPGFGIRWPR